MMEGWEERERILLLGTTSCGGEAAVALKDELELMGSS